MSTLFHQTRLFFSVSRGYNYCFEILVVEKRLTSVDRSVQIQQVFHLLDFHIYCKYTGKVESTYL